MLRRLFPNLPTALGKDTEIPPSQSRWGSFNILSESNRDVLHDILEMPSNKMPGGQRHSPYMDFYASCMDEAAIEKAGTKPLDDAFSQIAKAKTIDDVKHQIALMHKAGVPALFRLGGVRCQGQQYGDR